MTEQELSEIEARANAATPGKWEAEGLRSDRADLVIGGTRVASTCSSAECGFDRVEDMDFIAAAREDVPALIAEVRRLREVLWGPELRLYCARCQELVTPVFRRESELK